MRLKKQYTAIIVVVMLVFTAFIATFVLSSVQGSRVAYVAVKADKAVYEMGENVTFKLTPLTPGIECTLNGIGYGSGISMVRLPNDIDPETYLDDAEALQNISSGYYGYGSSGPAVDIPSFTTHGDPLSYSWNGTITAWDPATGNITWGHATAGYYLMYPVNFNNYNTGTKLMLDRSSIFYLGGLKVDFDITTEQGTCTVRTDLSLTDGMDAIDGTFSTVVPDYSGYYQENVTYHNETVHLSSGAVTTITVQFSSPGMESTTSLTCFVRSGDVTFIFGYYQSIYHYYQDNGVSITEVRNVQF